MNRTTINGVVYESEHSMSIINNRVVCSGDYYINGKLQGKNSTTSNESAGEITTKHFDVSNIKTLYNGFFGIELNIDPSIEKEELLITASESAHKKIEIASQRSNLLISSKNGMTSHVKLVFNAKSLEKVVNSGIGDVTGYVNTTSFMIDNDGTGNVKLSGKAQSLSLSNSGVGNINTVDLFADKVSLSNSGVGNVKVTSKVVSGSTSGVGNVHYYADNEARISKSGIGSVKYLGAKQFEDKPVEKVVEKTSLKVEPDNTKSSNTKSTSTNLNKNQQDTTKNDNVSFDEIEKSVQANKTLAPKEEMADLMNSISKKFKKLL